MSLPLQEWPEGSLEETVQNTIKTYEMELSHKINLQDFKTINPEKFKLSVNGIQVVNAKTLQQKILMNIATRYHLLVLNCQEEKRCRGRKLLSWEATTLCCNLPCRRNSSTISLETRLSSHLMIYFAERSPGVSRGRS